MNLDFWGPSEGRVWAPDTFTLWQSWDNLWYVDVSMRYFWVSTLTPPLGPPICPFTPCFDDFFLWRYNSPATYPPWFTPVGFPKFGENLTTDPAYLAWLGSPEAGSWNHHGVGENFEDMFVVNDPTSPSYTPPGIVRLMLLEDIDLTPLFPMAFSLSWPKYKGWNSLPPLVAKSASRDVGTV